MFHPRGSAWDHPQTQPRLVICAPFHRVSDQVRMREKSTRAGRQTLNLAAFALGLKWHLPGLPAKLALQEGGRMTNQEAPTNLRLHYTIMCEDVRVEINHKLSLMGIFYAMQVPQLPVTLLKLVILNHWSGEGQYLSEVRILTPDRVQPVAVSAPSPFQVPPDGYADNVTIFANVTFPTSGSYVVQSLINSNVFSEQELHISDTNQPQALETSETIQ